MRLDLGQGAGGGGEEAVVVESMGTAVGVQETSVWAATSVMVSPAKAPTLSALRSQPVLLDPPKGPLQAIFFHPCFPSDPNSLPRITLLGVSREPFAPPAAGFYFMLGLFPELDCRPIILKSHVSCCSDSHPSNCLTVLGSYVCCLQEAVGPSAELASEILQEIDIKWGFFG